MEDFFFFFFFFFFFLRDFIFKKTLFEKLQYLIKSLKEEEDVLVDLLTAAQAWHGGGGGGGVGGEGGQVYIGLYGRKKQRSILKVWVEDQ